MIAFLEDSPWILPALGVLVGVVLGAVARWSNFCTLSSLERYWFADDAKGVRTWALAIAISILCTQALAFAGVIDLQDSFYLKPNISVISTLLGGAIFGLGMALVGTCGFGALIRLGSGSLGSLVVTLVIGIVALATQRGFLNPLRETLYLKTQFSVSDTTSSIATLLPKAITDLAEAETIQFGMACIVVAVLLAYCLSSKPFRRNKKYPIAGFTIGLMITLGWLITTQLRKIMFHEVQVESASFVLPPGELMNVITSNSVADYGVGLVIGVVLGAAMVAKFTDSVHWEACDDPRELRRHLSGAVLMGIGGVMASGCTIGQGVSAASTLSITAPIALLGVAIGARVGLVYLLEGSVLPQRFRRE